ncbi:MAG TPA: proton-conducting transporter membrane subunit [Spirochaetia bacterium]|nr:proton-conducting transporter membrane subunit [Spirochaetia bacterium]
MILLPVLLPAVAAVIAFFIRAHLPRRLLLAATAALHTAVTAWMWVAPGQFPALGDWMALDGLGRLFLGITSLLFLAVSVYAVGFLQRESRGPAAGPAGPADRAAYPAAYPAADPTAVPSANPSTDPSANPSADPSAVRSADPEEGFLFTNIPEALFTACLLGFLAAMTLVTVSVHFGLVWVAIEATTLVSAPLIYYHRHHRSLEAAWKYILLCSVGIAVALLGTYFVAAAVPRGGGGVSSLTFDRLLGRAAELDPRWLKAGFLLLVVGYGTKMGLAPLHAWLPDAHSEAPSVVSALLSGALLNCAFLAILRVVSVLAAAGLGEFSRQTLLVFGLASMAVAAGLIIGQGDYKRMLAYSSVEHMGILAVGIGLGGTGDWGALFHAVNHSLTKAALFLLAGNLLAVYGTKKISEVGGAVRRIPVTGVLWIAGIFAILGAPPFGAFSSELAILRAAIGSGSWLVVVLYSLLLAAVFAGMIGVLVRMAQGTPPPGQAAAARTEPAWPARPALGGLVPAGSAMSHREPVLALLSPVALLAATLALGIFVPDFLGRTLQQAMRLLGA